MYRVNRSRETYRNTVVIASVWISASIEQILDNVEMALFSCAKQRCLTAQVHAECSLARRRKFDIGTAFAEIANAVEEALFRGQHQRRYAALVLMVRVRFVLEQQFHLDSHTYIDSQIVRRLYIRFLSLYLQLDSFISFYLSLYFFVIVFISTLLLFVCRFQKFLNCIYNQGWIKLLFYIISYHLI